MNNASSRCEKPLPAAFAMLGSVTANAGKGECKLLLWAHCGQRRSLSCLDDCIGFRTFFRSDGIKLARHPEEVFVDGLCDAGCPDRLQVFAVDAGSHRRGARQPGNGILLRNA